jgi:REP element-mobilizing transposase RayT
MERQHKFHRSLRVLDYDYSQAGAYFVTICTEQRLCHLGRIAAGSVQLAVPGQIVQEVWESLPQRYVGLELDAMVIMPNHVHGIVILPDGPSPPLGSIVRTFKAASTRLIREAGFPQFSWQGNYYEHVIRGYPELDRVRRYIANNPVQWELDEENPERQAR